MVKMNVIFHQAKVNKEVNKARGRYDELNTIVLERPLHERLAHSEKNLSKVSIRQRKGRQR